MTVDPARYYSAVRAAARGARRPSRRAQREIDRSDRTGRPDALRAVERAAGDGSSAEVLELARRRLDEDPAAHELLELYLEACRIQGEPPETAAVALAMAAEAGLRDGPDQRGLLDAVLFLDRPEHIEQLTASGDLVVRLVARLRGGRGETRDVARAAIESSETPGNAARALLVDAAWNRDLESLHDLTARVEAGWVPTVSLRRAVRAAVAERDAAWADALLTAYRAGAPADDPWAASIDERIRAFATDDEHVAQNGFPYSASAPRHPAGPLPGTVLYAVHSSYPHHRSGYSVRTHALARAMEARGIALEPVTRFGYPVDFGFTDVDAVDVVGGISYRRLLPSGDPMRKSPLVPYVMAYADRLEELAAERGAGIIHAASNFLNGFAANEAARRLGLPSVYEVRGLWEITRASRDPVWGESAEFRRFAALEAHAARGADHVITLTAALADEMVRRGVDRERITVVPNGVDPEAFDPRAAVRSGSPAGVALTFGYIGSLVDYEGLDLLIRALHSLRRKAPQIRARIVGDGAEAASLRRLAEDLHVADRVDFVGRVPHEAVLAEYREIDVLVFPRLPLTVCQLVAPLKPYEAMALQKPVIASDVAALWEIVAPCGPEAMFSAGSVWSLAAAMRRLAADPGLRERIAHQGHERVAQEASWASRAELLRSVYARVTGDTAEVGADDPSSGAAGAVVSAR